MTEMIERVSAAILAAQLQWNIDNEGYGGTVNVDCPNEVIARAAIEAMREPTEAMMFAPPDVNFSPEDAAFVWECMVGAALGEQKPR